jgi:hypothetical protein
MQSLKRFTAREGNRILGLTGHPFWQDESYDRLVRDECEFAAVARYIEMNPVNAGLVTQPEQFPWSSAGPITNRPGPMGTPANLPHSSMQNVQTPEPAAQADRPHNRELTASGAKCMESQHV